MIDLNETIIEKKNFFNRLVFVYLFFGMLFLFFLYRTFSLQVSSFTDYEIASLENKTSPLKSSLTISNKPRLSISEDFIRSKIFFFWRGLKKLSSN